MCGNRFLEAIINSVIKLNASILVEIKPDPVHSIYPPGLHLPVIEAVLTGDPEAAAEAMRNHALLFYENPINLEKNYRNRKVLGEWADRAKLNKLDEKV